MKLRITGIVLCLIALWITAVNAPAWAAPAKRAAIVIDDFGNDMQGTKEMMSLPFPITTAIMPFLPTTKRDAEWAHQAGHEVIVHLPMEPLSGRKDKWLGPGAITTDLPDDEIRRRVNAAVDDVPYAVGINNHMGSKVTADPRVIRIILEECKKRGLYFLDSHTNYRSIVLKNASNMGVPCIENQWFLDDTNTKRHVVKQIGWLRDYLKDHDQCVVIGHVGTGRKTAGVLKEAIPPLTNEIEFVRISELMKK
ncbi:divergent polysaccharide deacetylase family protein [Paenibacillus filicis]|uniref:Divergent polysaccharide deacetylase family protein n=1 Tax=Paenibacillus gyeongsangnamensis TaxID=3388067 RepID=A0ABT4Q4L2_9BACL|nr:divergent polysaccharide deacetylase family protein [Paenibacillus filicis]MCZ8511769.1 divergent polysaccharide deacetylase family protein [Paenibacillus filicis]